jgi:hypothetical protein
MQETRICSIIQRFCLKLLPLASPIDMYGTSVALSCPLFHAALLQQQSGLVALFPACQLVRLIEPVWPTSPCLVSHWDCTCHNM